MPTGRASLCRSHRSGNGKTASGEGREPERGNILPAFLWSRSSKKPANGRGPDPAPPPQRTRSITKLAEYVGSFTVEDLDLQQQAGRLEEQLRALKDCPRRRSVVLRFSLQGLKVYGADGEAAVGWESKGARSLAFLPENESVLAESVWAFAGIARDSGIALLRRDVPGAFLLRPEPGLPKRWCLWVRAPCGVVPYCLFRTQQGRFCVEHSNAEFTSVAALLAHYSGSPGGCFCPPGSS
nr:SH2 domain-containing protein 5 [Columba livia]